MTDTKLIVTKAAPEMVAAIDKASKITGRTRSSFVKYYAHLAAIQILQNSEGHVATANNDNSRS